MTRKVDFSGACAASTPKIEHRSTKPTPITEKILRLPAMFISHPFRSLYTLGRLWTRTRKIARIAPAERDQKLPKLFPLWLKAFAVACCLLPVAYYSYLRPSIGSSWEALRAG